MVHVFIKQVAQLDGHEANVVVPVINNYVSFKSLMPHAQSVVDNGNLV